ncbi:phosphatidylserine/phosphatidylglycerophosphate/cardiolipin synthase-like enzyme [Metabacillus crassostreae]|uniref:phospholipase D family protein n=1 Tax=Metabacillus crassostreae TaxID=929098 RepID=UPI0030844A26|nr:phosphatidylserine/phosphatidylglycerophosphate/cardiolipin synthase-like enzyme [Metabacillus crassostreae]
MSIYHTYKTLPRGISYESPTYKVDDVEFIYDLTYKDKNNDQVIEHSIFSKINETIRGANDFIVIDMFLLNNYVDGGQDFPNLSENLIEELVNHKRKNPDIEIVIITDKINTSYSSHTVEQHEWLEENNISVIYTDLNKLRDPNPIYSGIWRSFFQWFGQEGEGWLSNPLAEEAPNVTLRSYLKLLNIKANHRKVIATEDSAIITSANAHNASGFHSNIAFKVKGPIVNEIIQSEQAIANFSGNDKKFPQQAYEDKEEGRLSVQLLTEGKIQKHLIKEINGTKEKDTIWMAMFYLADTEVLEALKSAASRGVNINLILDPNQNAFGSEKMGLPNLPVAAELTELSNGKINIRWYNTGKEQFHSKFIFMEKGNENIIIGGSANFTERNLDNYNLETSLKITSTTNNEEVIEEVKRYFNKLWHNSNGTYTLDYEEYQEKLPLFKYVLYLTQKLFAFTTY